MYNVFHKFQPSNNHTSKPFAQQPDVRHDWSNWFALPKVVRVSSVLFDDEVVEVSRVVVMPEVVVMS